ncbi:MAG: UPF0158 family protein [Clostridiales bacterium]|nr:UPF0158 family protein [Clostridiales bacterium]
MLEEGKHNDRFVFLEDVAEELDMAFDDSTTYYNTETGEFTYCSDYFSSEMDSVEFEDEKYIALPSRYDIREYDMMAEFADDVCDEHKSELLSVALEGEGAFRRFKDTLSRVGLEDDWYRFKEEAYIEVARKWCQDYEIPYKVRNAAHAQSAQEGNEPYRHKCCMCGSDAKIHISGTQEASYCLECHNKLMAAQTGAEMPDAVPTQIVLFDVCEEAHAFAIESMIFPHCKSIRATEVVGTTCYKENVYGELSDRFEDMWSEMVRRLEKSLSKKYMGDDASFEDMKAVGYVDYNRIHDAYEVVIDGKAYTWAQLEKNLSMYEGWKIKIEFADMGDELE